jgi:hypothetical protein
VSRRRRHNAAPSRPSTSGAKDGSGAADVTETLSSIKFGSALKSLGMNVSVTLPPVDVNPKEKSV